MLNILKRKNIRKEDYTFLKSIASRLIDKYPYLVSQISKDFILDKKDNEFESKGTYTLILNAKLESKYINRKLPQFFIIKDIFIWNKTKNKQEPIEFDVMQGMLAGYKLTAKVSDLDLNKIDVSKIKEQNFNNQDKEELDKIIGDIDEKIIPLLSLNSSFKIDIPEGIFYVIKDLNNGDYISIDQNGSVYKMTHDPYEIKCIYKKKEDFFEAIMNTNEETKTGGSIPCRCVLK